VPELEGRWLSVQAKAKSEKKKKVPGRTPKKQGRQSNEVIKRGNVCLTSDPLLMGGGGCMQPGVVETGPG